MTHLKRFQNGMAKGEAALISSAQNQFYLSHFSYSDGYLLILKTEAFLLTDFRYCEAALESATEFTVLTPEKGLFSAVRELLLERGVTSLLLEENDLTLADRDLLSEALPGVTLTGGASKILTSLRLCKDEGELAAIRRAQAITDRAFAHILSVLRPDMTEVEVALELEFFMRREGSEGVAFDTIAVSGTASSRPHGTPRNVPLEKGFLTMDFGARVEGYCSDMTRTVVLGKADADMKKLYRTVKEAQELALVAAHEGASCRLLDLVAREHIEKAGYVGAFGHSLGHGVGIDIHEAPRLARRAALSEVLLPGHVVTVEPGIYLEGKYGCRIEDMIAVLPDGRVENMTGSPKDLIEI